MSDVQDERDPIFENCPDCGADYCDGFVGCVGRLRTRLARVLELLEPIAALAEQATPGPWFKDEQRSKDKCRVFFNRPSGVTDWLCDTYPSSTADYIAAANPAAILAAVRAGRGE